MAFMRIVKYLKNGFRYNGLETSWKFGPIFKHGNQLINQLIAP